MSELDIWKEKRRIAIQAWELGKSLGYPLIRPELEVREYQVWCGEGCVDCAQTRPRVS